VDVSFVWPLFAFVVLRAFGAVRNQRKQILAAASSVAGNTIAV
jgi:hypothetical protein